MGNRAVITTKDKKIGVYLHWNGGRDCVEAFLKYCELKGFRCPEEDNYGWACMCQIIANYFGDGLSLGIDRFEDIEYSACYDNGVYIIENWQIVDREGFGGEEQDLYNLKKMVHEINDCQPEKVRLNPGYIERMVE